MGLKEGNMKKKDLRCCGNCKYLKGSDMCGNLESKFKNSRVVVCYLCDLWEYDDLLEIDRKM